MDTGAEVEMISLTTMPLIEPGTKAPAFTLKDQAGKTHRLADYEGQPIVLYFYPKDDTPGCTKEACAFRDQLPRFKTNKAVVLGVSILDEASKGKFAGKYDLNFPLLADADHDGGGQVRRVAAAVALRPQVHGRRANDLSDRQRRQSRPAMGQRQGRQARRRGARGRR